MKRLFYLILITFQIAVFAADKKYPVSDIPDSLKKNMYAVIREEEHVITIIDINKSSRYSRQVVTILNKNADFMANEAVLYDKLTKVSFFKGAVYDAEGNLIKRLKSTDFYDRSYVSEGSLFDDSRLKEASLAQTIYPYTVEFEYEVNQDFLYSFPDFHLYDDDEVSAQKKIFKIVYNPKYPPRFKTFKIADPIKSIDSENRGVFTWTFQNIIPDKFEPYSPEMNKFVPYILAGPSEFEYSGYRGNMKTWVDFAKWKTDLLKGRDELPEATKAKIIALTKDLPTVEQKVKVLYEYLQSKTRYINISLGIGGLQPFPASVVDQVGYGDCKALSNYMIAMLKVIGIEGLYATIMAGENDPDVVVDFPTHQSNHVIVSVPNVRDTIWLECTSQTKAYGFMGTFTGGRKALINTPTGGHLVNTPSYPAEQNIQSRTVNVFLDGNGDAKASSKTTFKGLQYENGGLDFIVNMPGEKQKEWIQKTTNIPNFDLTSFSMTNVKSRLPSVIVKSELTLRKLATISGKRFFINPNLMNRSSNIPPKVENRKTEVLIKVGYVDWDTIQFNLPENLYPEFAPEPIKHASRFGEYEVQFKVDQGKLIYIRKMKMREGVYPPESYNELIEFRKNISKADNTKVVFLNKT
jgi:hypothetical protein